MNNLEINTKLVNLMRLIRVGWFCVTPITYIILVNVCWFSTLERNFWFSCVCSIILFKIVDILIKELIESYASSNGVPLPDNYK
jgi:hypothetical protein